MPISYGVAESARRWGSSTPPTSRTTSRVTEAEAAAQGARIARRGRPSLTGDAATSPQIGVRLTPELNARLRARARQEGKRPSEVVRDALESYV